MGPNWVLSAPDGPHVGPNEPTGDKPLAEMPSSAMYVYASPGQVLSTSIAPGRYQWFFSIIGRKTYT